MGAQIVSKNIHQTIARPDPASGCCGNSRAIKVIATQICTSGRPSDLCIGRQLSAHINALRIIEATMCDVKAVTDQICKIERQAENVVSASSLAKSTHWLSKLLITMTPPKGAKTESEIARHIALGFVATKFETVENMQSGRAFTSSVSTAATFGGLIWADENICRLRKYTEQVKTEVKQTNDEALVAIRGAVGRLLIDGKPLYFSPIQFVNRGSAQKAKRWQVSQSKWFSCIGGWVA
jgi:hypothetical protein